MKLAVVLVHGIGDQAPNWADGFIRRLQDQVRNELSHLLLRPAPPLQEIFAIDAVY